MSELIEYENGMPVLFGTKDVERATELRWIAYAEFDELIAPAAAMIFEARWWIDHQYEGALESFWESLDEESALDADHEYKEVRLLGENDND